MNRTRLPHVPSPIAPDFQIACSCPRDRASMGGNQHPVMKGEMDGLLPLVKVGDQ